MLAASSPEEHKHATRAPPSEEATMTHSRRRGRKSHATTATATGSRCVPAIDERGGSSTGGAVDSSDDGNDHNSSAVAARSSTAAAASAGPAASAAAAAAASIAASVTPASALASAGSSALDELDPALQSFARLLLTRFPVADPQPRSIHGERTAAATSSSSLRKRLRDDTAVQQCEPDSGNRVAAASSSGAVATAAVAATWTSSGGAATRISAPSSLSSPSPGKPVRRGRPPKRWNYDNSGGAEAGAASAGVAPQCAFPSAGALVSGRSPFLWENSVDRSTPLNFLYITSNHLHPSTCHAASVGAGGHAFMLPCSCPAGRCRPSTCDCAQAVENQYTTAGEISGRQSDYQRYSECSDLCPCACNEKPRATAASSSSAAAAAPPSPIVLDDTPTAAAVDKRRKRSVRQAVPSASVARCFNRVVQRNAVSSRVLLAVFRTPGGERGWGLKTLTRIPRAAFVAEYLGERIHEYVTEARGKLFEKRKEMTYVMTPHPREQVEPDFKATPTAAAAAAAAAAGAGAGSAASRLKTSSSSTRRKRGRRKQRIGGNFSSSDDEEEEEEESEFSSDEGSGSCSGGASSEDSDDPHQDWQHSNEPYSIDASAMGGVARFCNHSHKPNLVAVEVLIEHRDPRLPRFALFARKNILPGTELTFNYGVKHTSKQEFVCTCVSCKEVDKKQEAITRKEAAADAKAAAVAAARKGASSPAAAAMGAGAAAAGAKSKGKATTPTSTPTASGAAAATTAAAAAATKKKFARMRHSPVSPMTMEGSRGGTQADSSSKQQQQRQRSSSATHMEPLLEEREEEDEDNIGNNNYLDRDDYMRPFSVSPSPPATANTALAAAAAAATPNKVRKSLRDSMQSVGGVGSAAPRSRLSASPPAPTPALAPAFGSAAAFHAGSWGIFAPSSFAAAPTSNENILNSSVSTLGPPSLASIAVAAAAAVISMQDALSATAQPMDMEVDDAPAQPRPAAASHTAKAPPVAAGPNRPLPLPPRQVFLEISDSSDDEEPSLRPLATANANANANNEVNAEEGEDMPPLVHVHSPTIAAPPSDAASLSRAPAPAPAPLSLSHLHSQSNGANVAAEAASSAAAVTASATATVAAASSSSSSPATAAVASTSPRLFSPSELAHLLWLSSPAHARGGGGGVDYPASADSSSFRALCAEVAQSFSDAAPQGAVCSHHNVSEWFRQRSGDTAAADASARKMLPTLPKQRQAWLQTLVDTFQRAASGGEQEIAAAAAASLPTTTSTPTAPTTAAPAAAPAAAVAVAVAAPTTMEPAEGLAAPPAVAVAILSSSSPSPPPIAIAAPIAATTTYTLPTVAPAAAAATITVAPSGSGAEEVGDEREEEGEEEGEWPEQQGEATWDLDSEPDSPMPGTVRITADGKEIIELD